MPAALSPYGRQLMLSSFFAKGGVDVVPDTLFACLTMGVDISVSSGDRLQEPGPGYSRVPMDMTIQKWVISDQSIGIYQDDIVFPYATEFWGTITGWAIVTEVQSGMVIMSGSLVQAIKVDKGDVVYFPRDSIKLSLDV